MANNIPRSGSTGPASPLTIIIERGRSGGNWLIGLALVLLLAVGGYFLLAQNRNEAVRTDAIGAAATQGSGGAEKARSVVERAVDPD